MVPIPHPSRVYTLTSINGGSSSRAHLFSSSTFKAKPTRAVKILSLGDSKSDFFPTEPPDDSSIGTSNAESTVSDPVKLALERARAYKKSKKLAQASSKKPVLESAGAEEKRPANSDEVPTVVKISMEKADEYRKKKEVAGGNRSADISPDDSGLQNLEAKNLKRDVSESRMKKKESPTISNIDFLGLEFSDKKKSRGPPAGLITTEDPFADKDFIEVELIVGDTSKFAADKLAKTAEGDEGSDLYKPKVSTWGVFPRPSNISKTFGGGRSIQPGESLETVEDKAANEARTRQLIAAYKSKMGLNIDAKTKAECEKALKEGDNLMDLGKLREALPYYEKVMKAVTFKSELHGRAALQWSICQDSLSRPNEARVMYEKLQAHPNVQVSKKAKQFTFSFQAMEMLKVTTSSSMPSATGYQGYFEAFVEDRGEYAVGRQEESGEVLRQTLPYLLILVAPILLVALIAARKGL